MVDCDQEWSRAVAASGWIKGLGKIYPPGVHGQAGASRARRDVGRKYAALKFRALMKVNGAKAVNTRRCAGTELSPFYPYTSAEPYRQFESPSLRQPSSPTVSPPWTSRRFSPVFADVWAGTPYRLISFAPFTFSKWPLFSEALYFAHSVRNPFFFIFQALPAWDSVDTSSFSRSSDKASDRIGDARTKQPPRARQSSNPSEVGRFRKRAGT
jgi:hypothetical protein